MAKVKKPQKQVTVAIAATKDDLKLLEVLKARTGLNNTGVIRMSMRQFAENLNIQVA